MAPPVEKLTYFQYREGIDVSRVWIGNIALDYANPKLWTPYVHDSTMDLSDWITKEPRLNCCMAYQSDKESGGGLGIQGLLEFDLTRLRGESKLVVGATGHVAELKNPEKFFKDVILKSKDAQLWLSSHLTAIHRFSLKRLTRPTLWLLTGLYEISDGRSWTISQVASNFEVGAAVPVAEPTGIAALLMGNVGARVHLGNGRLAAAGTTIPGSKVWAAQWQKIDAKYTTVDTWDESITKFKLTGTYSTGRSDSSEPDETVVAEVGLDPSTEKSTRDGEGIIPNEDLKELEDEVMRVKFRQPQPLEQQEPSQKEPTYWAVFIGVDFYMKGSARPGINFHNLGGCVEDVSLVKEYLCAKYSLKERHIYELTATTPPNTDQNVPVEPPEQWPTYANIINTLTEVTEKAKKDDLVYIHYSGHGVRVVTIFDGAYNLKASGSFDEALAPTDIARHGRYIRDVEIATMLQDMTRKKLRVTLVLDCCHSGGGHRGEALRTRGIDVHDSNKLDSDISVIPLDKLKSDKEQVKGRTSRSGKQKHWLENAKGYAFLAACLPDETAQERLFDGKTQGVLTYLLIDAMKKFSKSSEGLSYWTIHDQIRTRIKEFNSQTPVLGGESERQFFGSKELPNFYTAIVIAVPPNATSGSIVELNVGEAHGIASEAEFDVWPIGGYLPDDTSNSPARLDSAKRIARLRVSNVNDTTSDAILIDMVPNSLLLGCPAVQRSNGYPSLVKVSQSITNGQSGILTEFTSSDSGKYVELMSDGTSDSPDFIVTAAESSKHEVRASLAPLAPELEINHLVAPEKLVHHLTHWTKYFSVQRIKNLEENPLKFQVSVAGKRSAGEDVAPQTHDATRRSHKISCQHIASQNGIYELEERETIVLCIKNPGDKKIYVSVLDLSSSWRIRQIYPSDRGADARELDNGTAVDVPIYLSLSSNLKKGLTTGIDIFKVYATTEPVNFRTLELPALETEVSPMQLRPKPELERSAGRDGEVRLPDSLPGVKWATEQIIVRTTRRS